MQIKDYINAITKGLSKRPAYLLIFGICVLAVAYGNLVPGQTISWQITAILGCGLLVAGFIIVWVERPSGKTDITGNDRIDPKLRSVCESVRSAIRAGATGSHPNIQYLGLAGAGETATFSALGGATCEPTSASQHLSSFR